MPELPEVENVRRGLVGHVVGQTVTSVQVLRPDVVRGSISCGTLLRGQKISAITRHGKQIALLGSNPRAPSNPPCVCIHLGMSGSLRYIPPMGGDNALHDEWEDPNKHLSHTHAIWHLSNSSEIHFRDPRRFGGIWSFPSRSHLLHNRWDALGDDAMIVKPLKLHHLFQNTRRSLKATLLDQTIVAGLGNIYVDELLHRCSLHPLTPCPVLDIRHLQLLVRRMRRLLDRATCLGGSSLRDFVGCDGYPGGFQMKHRVYGRGGNPCLICDTTLASIKVIGRTTVFCPRCQSRRPSVSSRY